MFNILYTIWQNRKAEILALLCAGWFCFILETCVAEHRLQEQGRELRNAYATLDTIRHKALNDSLSYALQDVYEANDLSELKNQLSENAKVISAMTTKKERTILASKSVSQSAYHIPLRIDTVNHHDTVFITKGVNYHDQWLDITCNDTAMNIATRDSILTIINRRYRHRFLWWRWGTKGYTVRIINFNPHSTITYNKTIIVNNGK